MPVKSIRHLLVAVLNILVNALCVVVFRATTHAPWLDSWNIYVGLIMAAIYVFLAMASLHEDNCSA